MEFNMADTGVEKTSIMQSTRKVLSLTRSNRNIVRSVAVNSAPVNDVDTKTQLKSWREIPGPSSLPIIGQLLHFLPGGALSDQKTLHETLYKKYGPITRLDALLGKRAFVLLFDAEACALILRNENKQPIRPGLDSLEYYRKNHRNKTEESNMKPTGLVTDHGETWRQLRTTVNPVMLQPKTINLYRSPLEEVSQDLINRMRSKRDEKNMIQGKFDVEMNLWAIESIAVVAFGCRLGCLSADLPPDSPASRLIQIARDFFTVVNELDFKPSVWKWFATPTFKKAMKIFEEQENISKYFIRKAMNDLKNKKNVDEEKAVLEKLLEIDEDTAVVMAIDMVFAGGDVAATTATAALYFLAKNQDKQEKLRQEVTSGSNKTYLRACIKETLRIMPIVGGNARTTSREYSVLGYRIPKGMAVILCHQYLSSMEEHYPRAKEFIPERWFDKESPLHYSSAHPFTYNPFGFGVRSCVGRRIAELELEIILSKMVKNFKIEWFGPPLNVQPLILNCITGPYNFTFKDV